MPGGGQAFALRLLPPGDGSGGLIVADRTNIKRLDGAGAVVQIYDAAGENNWFAMNLDPNGTSFWAADFGTSNFYRFNIVTGAIEVGPINTGTGSNTVFGLAVKGEPTAAQVLRVALDIKPNSCPNPLNLKSKGVLPVAILGSNTFDVTQIDVLTVALEGVAPLRSSLEDVATPFVPITGREDALDCTEASADGFVDLTLKFDRQDVVAALGSVNDGDVLVLQLTGNLLPAFGGTAFTGEDVVVILKKGK